MAGIILFCPTAKPAGFTKNMSEYLSSKSIFYAVIFVLLIFSLAGNIFLFNKIKNSPSPFQEKSKLLSSFINIPIDSNIQSDGVVLHYHPLREKIEEKLKSLSVEQEFGIYLQDAKIGSWLGINEKESFVPASLLKIPIATAVFKKIERGELKTDQKIEIIQEDLDTLAGAPERLAAGHQETVWNLIELMIKDSDNTAKNVLKRQLLPEEINEVFTHVGIDNPYLKEDDNALVTPRQFSRLFKALYFSTFLTPKFSEKLLDLATETRVESLIAAGVPWEIQVAHKYGERFDLLHDCGIVYHPQSPYFLCIMTKDIPLTEAKDLIKDISSEVYKFVSEK